MTQPKTVVCSECGRGEPLKYTRRIMKEMLEKRLCFSCLFWHEKCNMKHDPRQVIVNGVCYFVGSEDSPYKAFGGDLYIIQFLDGKTLSSTNLWCNGSIPLHYRERLPDNAKFLPKEVSTEKV